MASRTTELDLIAQAVRFHIIDMVHEAQSGHVSPGLGAADIVTALYFETMRIDPNDPDMADRDRFVLSKGHSCPVLYAALALRGYFPVEELKTLRRLGSRLQGHPVKGTVPGIEATSGSLGMGACQAVGMALEGRMLGKDYDVWALLGDGELDEGVIWETSASAAKYKLGNLVFIVDRNGLQTDGPCESVMPMEPIDKKFEAFNWKVMKMDGHDMLDILTTLQAARDYRSGPVCVIAKTIKGKGVHFMENTTEWHAKAPNDEQYARAVAELRAGRT
ncbi:MAG: transketolase [Acidobacteria bacterium]|nr:transketolase [Acidobacteriota bacterium]